MSSNAERMVLSEIMLDNTAIEDINLVPDDFKGISERIVFSAMNDLYADNKPIDLVSLVQKLTEQKKLDAAGGITNITMLGNEAFTAALIKQHAEIVKTESLRRQVARMLLVSNQKLKDYESVAQVLDEIQDEIIKLNTVGEKKSVHSAKELANDYALMAKSRKNVAEYGMNTGYGELDGMIKGLRKGALVVLAARPSMGKTAFALNISQSVARKKNVLFFSLEMRCDEIMQRIFNSETALNRVPPERVVNDFDNVMDFMAQKIGDLGLWVCDDADVKINDIRKCARQVRQRAGNLDLIVVDYLQLMVSQNKNVNRVQEVTELTRSLKILARELDVPIIILSQLNRGVEQRNDKRPMMSDLRESGSIEQDADVVMMLYREYVYDQNTENPEIAELIVNKNRAGSIGTIYLTYNAEATLFRSIDTRTRQNLLHAQMMKQVKSSKYGDEEE